MINFAEHVCKLADLQPEKVAVYDGHATLTYRGLADRVKKLATHIGHIPAGSNIVISMEDCVDWPVCFLACVYNGQVPVPLSPAVGDQLLGTIIDFIDAKLVMAGQRTYDRLSDNQFKLSRDHLTGIFSRSTSNTVLPKMMHPDSPGFIGLSSGTTNHSKAAVHRHQSFFEAIAISPDIYELTSNSRVLCTPKMSWGWGLLNSLICCLGRGATSIVIPDAPVAKTVLDYAHRFRPCTVISSPSIIKRLLKHSGRLPDSVKSVHSAGEDLPRQWYDEFYKQYGFKIQCEFGQLETWISYCYQTRNDIVPGTVGKPLRNCQYKIINDQGLLCAPGETGEIYACTPTMAMYYYKNWAKTKSTFHGEWVKTGDLGYQDAQGNLVFCGRVDDVFKVNAMMIAPVEIENMLLTNKTVEQVAVAGISNDHGIKEIHAFVVPGDNFDKEKFTTFIQQNLFRHQIPKHMHIVEQLPETVTSKKVRTNLQDYVAALNVA